METDDPHDKPGKRTVRNLLTESDRKIREAEENTKRKQKVEKLLENLEKEKDILQEKKNSCDREQTGLTTKAYENEKQQKNAAEEIRQVHPEAGKEVLEKEIREKQQEYIDLKENSRKMKETFERFQAEKARITSTIKTLDEQQKEIGEIREDEIREQYTESTTQKTELAEKRKELFSHSERKPGNFPEGTETEGRDDKSRSRIRLDEKSLRYSQRQFKRQGQDRAGNLYPDGIFRQNPQKSQCPPYDHEQRSV